MASIIDVNEYIKRRIPVSADKGDVSVESIIHNEIRESMQYISERYGINVNSIDITWMDVSAHDRKSFIIKEITLNTTSVT